ncbi:MAG: hypothetical protein CFE24_05335 [Flavobacterium sp. BFFFF2]|nr:MAG: hypothetical protein CFE24_05335 [Flavobacterium sp. BFFFF2]
MKRYFLATTLLIFSHCTLSAQVNELVNLRKKTTLFVQYDQGKIDSLPKTDATTIALKKSVETAFFDFIKHKDSKNLDNLRKNSIDNKSSYIIGKMNYFFSNLRRNRYKKELENNVNYSIGFYGFYDYKLPDFVSIQIQPFTIDNIEFVIYYYHLNGVGTYYIKEVISNKIIFESPALTSNCPVVIFNKLDKNHLLLVEDMGSLGQRAFVINTVKKWHIIPAFKGMAFKFDDKEYAQKADVGLRTYARFAESKSIINGYGPGFIEKYEMKFDEKTKTLSYGKYKPKKEEEGIISAQWTNHCFTMDDYFLGENMEDPSQIPRE